MSFLRRSTLALALVMAPGVAAGPDLAPARRVLVDVVGDLEGRGHERLARELEGMLGPPAVPTPVSWLTAGEGVREPEPPSARAAAAFLRDLGRTGDLARLLGALPPEPRPLWVTDHRTWLAEVRGQRTLGAVGDPSFDWERFLPEELRTGAGREGPPWVRALVAQAWKLSTWRPRAAKLRIFLRRVLAEGHLHAGFFRGAVAGPEEAEVLLLLARALARSPRHRRAATRVYQVLVARTHRPPEGPEASRVWQAGDLGRRELAALWSELGARSRARRVRRDQLARTRARRDFGRPAVADRIALAETLVTPSEALALAREALVIAARDARGGPLVARELLARVPAQLRAAGLHPQAARFEARLAAARP